MKRCVLWVAAGCLNLLNAGAAPSDCDPAFQVGSALNGQIWTMEMAPAGGLLIGGEFYWVHGAVRPGLARLLPNGAPDSTFSPSLVHTDSWDQVIINHLSVQPDGKLLVAGLFDQVDNLLVATQPSVNHLVRLDPAGRLDSSFSGWQGSDGWISGTWLYPDGRILLWGAFETVNGTDRRHLVRLLPDGSLDPSFTVSAATNWQSVSDVVVQTNGAIVLLAPDLQGFPKMARLFPSGEQDLGFEVTIEADATQFNDLAVDSEDCLLVAGFFFGINGVSAQVVARLLPDGDVDPSFNFPLPESLVHTICPLADGQLLLGGHFGTNHLLRLHHDGSVDPGFLSNRAGPDDSVTCIRTSATNLFIGGNFASVNGYGCGPLAKLSLDGELNQDYLQRPEGPDVAPNQMVRQSDGKLVVAGEFTFVDGALRPLLARLNDDGSTDTSFPAFTEWLGQPGYVGLTLTVDPQDRLLVAGAFAMVQGVSQPWLARLLPTGLIDTTFRPAFTHHAGTPAIDHTVVQSDGKILISGSFHTVNGLNRTNLARLNSDGSTDPGFGPVMVEPYNDPVFDLATDSQGRILLCGNFRSINGVARPGLARILPNGAIDTSFLTDSSRIDGPVVKAVPLANGKILIAGDFTSINGVAQCGLSRLHPDGRLDTSFASALTSDAIRINQILVQEDEKLVLSLDYRDNACPFYPTNLVRLTSSGALDAILARADPAHPALLAACLEPDGKVVFATESLAGHAGYLFRVTNACAALEILSNPQDRTSEIGASAQFKVGFSGYPPPDLLWLFGQAVIPSATNAVLAWSPVEVDQAGAYRVCLSNAFGCITSAPAMLSVVVPVPRRLVPGVRVSGDPGSVWEIQRSDSLASLPTSPVRGGVTLAAGSGYWFDLEDPLPAFGFYRAQAAPGVTPCTLELQPTPALTLTGEVGAIRQIDWINVVGPVSAWLPLATVPLTNTTQLYFDTSAFGQPERVYRLRSP